jgi:archaeosine-15-forming tRNA-guanine transglycosylase
MSRKTNVTEIGGEVPTNGAMETVEVSKPYVVNVKIQGVSDFLFHRYNVESVKEKTAAAKGSKGKKTDDLESYVYRNDAGELCIPGEYLRQSCIHAAKYRQDPRSPRKSAMDLYKAGLISLTSLASLGKTKWDYEDCRRVVIQRSAIPRTRPAIKAGYEVTIQFMVNLPEYIRPNDLHDVLTNAGRLVGLGDFRPTYGRFQIVSFDVGLE